MLRRRWKAILCSCVGAAILAGLLTIALGQNEDARVILPPVTFSHASGFYDDAFYLEIEGNGNPIYYTLDSSDPDERSIPYTGPILIQDASANENVYSAITDMSAYYDRALLKRNNKELTHDYRVPGEPVDKATVIRAVSVDTAGNRSPAATAVYFVSFGEKKGYNGVNIMSVTTDPSNLFDHEKGIYVLGDKFAETLRDGVVENSDSNVFMWPANYHQRGKDWERLAEVHSFDSTGEPVFSGPCGIRIQGRATRANMPKNLNLNARREYGCAAFDTGDLFDREYTLNRLNLYFGSNDLMLRDYLVNALVGDMDVVNRAFCPCALFLDGEYWGLYWLASRFKADYLNQKYGVDADNIVAIKRDRIEIGREEDVKLFEDMVSFIADSNMRKPENYEQACAMIDLQSCVDYFAVEIYIANTDWPLNNYALWRSRRPASNAYSDGRWRWMLFDVEHGMRPEYAKLDALKRAINHEAMFASLMQNEEFSAMMTERLLNLATDTFAPERMDAFIDAYEADMADAIEKKYQRFYGEYSMDDLFYRGCDEVREFFRMRQAYILEKYGRKR